MKHVAGDYCNVISRLGTPCFEMSELDGGRSACVSDQTARCNVFILLMTSSCVWAQRGGGQHDVMKAGPGSH